jgi:hypothetical protein
MDILGQEWWAVDHESFDGGWVFEDYGYAPDDSARSRCLARMLIVQVVAAAVRDGRRNEDIVDEIALAKAYLDELELGTTERNSCTRLLEAVIPFSPTTLCHELLQTSWAALHEDMQKTARCFAELAYISACAAQSREIAQGAALALAHLAKMQECHATRDHWHAVAREHERAIVGE